MSLYTLSSSTPQGADIGCGSGLVPLSGSIREPRLLTARLADPVGGGPSRPPCSATPLPLRRSTSKQRRECRPSQAPREV